MCHLPAIIADRSAVRGWSTERPACGKPIIPLSLAQETRISLGIFMVIQTIVNNWSGERRPFVKKSKRANEWHKSRCKSELERVAHAPLEYSHRGHQPPCSEPRRLP